MPSSRGYSRPRDRTQVSCASCIAGRFLTCWAIREVIKTCTRQTRKYTYIYIRHTYICKYICMYVYMYTCICIMHLLSMYACLYIHFNAVWQIKQKQNKKKEETILLPEKKKSTTMGPLESMSWKVWGMDGPAYLKNPTTNNILVLIVVLQTISPLPQMNPYPFPAPGYLLIHGMST